MTNKHNPWYEELLTETSDLEPIVTAIVHPVDALSLQGAIESAKANLIVPVLVGPEARIRTAAKDANLDISHYQLINTQHSVESAQKSVELAKTGKVEALMKGNIHTDELMHAVIAEHSGLRTGRRMSHVSIIEITSYHKPLFLTDVAINIAPNLSEKCDIVQNAIDLFTALGLGIPKVAILSATENVNEKIPSTLDATALCKMSDRGQITGGIIDGPLGFDLALSKEIAQIKGLKSQVAGDADIIVFPDIESGNMVYKQMTFMSKSQAAGIVVGSSVPIILTSRGSDIDSRKASCLIALIYIRRKKI